MKRAIFSVISSYALKGPLWQQMVSKLFHQITVLFIRDLLTNLYNSVKNNENEMA